MFCPKAYYIANREKLLAGVKRNYAKNKKAIKLYRKQWRKKNKVRLAANLKKWKSENPDRMKELRKIWRKLNPDRVKEIAKQYANSKKGRAVMRNVHSRRRAQIYGCDTPATTSEIKRLLQKAKECTYCKKPFTRKRKATLDHIIPLSKKGSHSIHNLCAACLSCNSSKNALMLHEWKRHQD